MLIPLYSKYILLYTLIKQKKKGFIMQVQWFPGHMHKARKQIKENLKRVDMLWELRDARAPLASINPILQDLGSHKPRIIILNKMDRSDPVLTKLWVKELSLGNTQVVSLTAIKNNTLNPLIQKTKQRFQQSRWFQRRPIRIMILGIPNIGKSTLINSLAGKKKAPVANSPGFTRDVLRYDTQRGIQIFDSPGILWPKFEDKEVGYLLASLGSIRDSILPQEEIAQFALERIMSQYPRELKTRYDLGENPLEWLHDIGAQRGALLSGGVVDLDKAAMFVLKDLRDGKLGRVTLEHPHSDKRNTLEVDTRIEDGR